MKKNQIPPPVAHSPFLFSDAMLPAQRVPRLGIGSVPTLGAPQERDKRLVLTHLNSWGDRKPYPPHINPAKSGHVQLAVKHHLVSKREWQKGKDP